ncbi:S-adenosyl-L-methionine-dependent methyltransferase [Mycena capillaripes]|nr:S-adenosyl-L-methionine-dependent methyltransferase [Mycena capillaripes]
MTLESLRKAIDLRICTPRSRPYSSTVFSFAFVSPSAQTLGPSRRHKSSPDTALTLQGKGIEEYITIQDPELKILYYGKNKIPMQVFHDAYFEGKIRFKGDVLETIEQRHDWAKFTFTPELFRYDFMNFIPEIINQHEEQVLDHYDGGDDFYLWYLGPRIIYTSGVVCSPDTFETPETIQDKKLAIVCNKPDLQPTDRSGRSASPSLLYVGCGWGTLVAAAAENSGCGATGVTLGKNQAKFNTERIAKNGVKFPLFLSSCRLPQHSVVAVFAHPRNLRNAACSRTSCNSLQQAQGLELYRLNSEARILRSRESASFPACAAKLGADTLPYNNLRRPEVSVQSTSNANSTATLRARHNRAQAPTPAGAHRSNAPRRRHTQLQLNRKCYTSPGRWPPQINRKLAGVHRSAAHNYATLRTRTLSDPMYSRHYPRLRLRLNQNATLHPRAHSPIVTASRRPTHLTRPLLRRTFPETRRTRPARLTRCARPETCVQYPDSAAPHPRSSSALASIGPTADPTPMIGDVAPDGFTRQKQGNPASLSAVPRLTFVQGDEFNLNVIDQSTNGTMLLSSALGRFLRTEQQLGGLVLQYSIAVRKIKLGRSSTTAIWVALFLCRF